MSAITGNNVLDFIIDNAEDVANGAMTTTEDLTTDQLKMAICLLQQSLTALQMEYKHIYTELIDHRMNAQTSK